MPPMIAGVRDLVPEGGVVGVVVGPDPVLLALEPVTPGSSVVVLDCVAEKSPGEVGVDPDPPDVSDV